MPTALIDLPANVEPCRKRWTRAEYEELMSLGVPGLDQLELIDGELIDKIGERWLHVIAVFRMALWATKAFAEDVVFIEGPIDVLPEDNPASEPEPDIVALKQRPSPKRNPVPREVHLIIEVSDSTLGFDLTTKAGLYARAGIVEYWVLDVNGRRLIVHRDAGGSRYQSVSVYDETESVAPLAAPESPFHVRDAFLD